MDVWIRGKLGMQARKVKTATPVDITNSFHESIQKGYSFVRFYAPWCSHCVAMKPVYERLAGAEDSVKIAEVDCTKTQLCSQLGIRAYPTLWFYKDGVQVAEFEGNPTFEALRQFVDQTRAEQDAISSVQIEDIGSKVPETKGFYFVKFFAPWCDHCQRMEPEFRRLKVLLQKEDGETKDSEDTVHIASVDCT